MQGPLVSVILPVHNGERFLAAAIASALAQDYQPIEVIVVDDGSTDGTAGIARSFQAVRYLYQPNQGPARARNAGIEVARGEFLAFLDADDLMVPTRLSVQAGYLLTHPEIGCVLAREEIILEPGVESQPWLTRNPLPQETGEVLLHPGNRREALAYIRAGLMSVAVRAEVVRAVGDFDPRLRHGEDVEWLLRLWQAGVRMAVLPDVLNQWRIHGSNLTSQRRAVQLAWLRLLKCQIDRKRAARPPKPARGE